jgi:acyl dehydratase
MIRRWVEAMGDANPIYVDEHAAVAAGRAGIVAPPAMLPVWTMPGLRGVLDASRTASNANRGVFVALAEAGFTLTPGVNLTHHYARELQVGDRLQAAGTIAAVSEEKQTALGPAHFVDLSSRYYDDDGALVGKQVLRVIAYNPSADRRTHAATSESAAATDAGDLEQLPPVSVTLDRLGVIACTTACNDFRAGHYDPDLARAIGMRDIFTDIPTSAGLAARYITEWAGPPARLVELDVALGVPFCAGDTLSFTGSASRPRSDGTISVAVRGHTTHGRHLRATAVVYPAPPPAPGIVGD